MDEQIKQETGTKFKDMTGAQKTIFILKVIVCVLTFGMAFPNVMSE